MMPIESPLTSLPPTRNSTSDRVPFNSFRCATVVRRTLIRPVRPRTSSPGARCVDSLSCAAAPSDRKL